MRLPLRHLNTVVVMEANLLPVLLTIGISIIYIYICIGVTHNLLPVH